MRLGRLRSSRPQTQSGEASLQIAEKERPGIPAKGTLIPLSGLSFSCPNPIPKALTLNIGAQISTMTKEGK